MNIDDKTYELIEKYLGGLLSAEEKAAFESRLSKDNLLRDQVEIFRMMPGYLQNDDFPSTEFESDHPKAKAYLDEYLKEETKAVREHLNSRGEQKVETPKRQPGLWQLMRVAAAILILFAAATFLLRPPEHVRLYAKYTEHEEVSFTVRGVESERKQKAENFYNRKNYAKALPILEELDEFNDNDFQLKLALGIARLETGNSVGAVSMFKEIYESDAIIRDDALYYHGMALLKDKEYSTAVKILRRVQKEFPEYRTGDISLLIQRLEAES